MHECRRAEGESFATRSYAGNSVLKSNSHKISNDHYDCIANGMQLIVLALYTLLFFGVLALIGLIVVKNVLVRHSFALVPARHRGPTFFYFHGLIYGYTHVQ